MTKYYVRNPDKDKYDEKGERVEMAGAPVVFGGVSIPVGKKVELSEAEAKALAERYGFLKVEAKEEKPPKPTKPAKAEKEEDKKSK